MRKCIYLVLTTLISVLIFNLIAQAADFPPVRVKDVVQIRGARNNQLKGFGLVIGLGGTGDSPATIFTNNALKNMMERLGMPNLGQAKVKNVAGVLVTANLPPFYKQGQFLDVTVSSLGDAKSLENGFLVQTPLTGADGRVYAVAQGPISLGGFGIEVGGAKVQKNFLTVARIPNGGIIEKEVPVTMIDENGYMYIDLFNPDYTTSAELANKINKNLLGNATALDPATVRVFVTSTYKNNVVDLIARIENLTLNPKNMPAKIVLDERTGTIVIGQNVTIAPVAISHGGLKIIVEETPVISQPAPMSSGQTVVTKQTTITATEEKGNAVQWVEGSTVGTLVKTLHALGIPPRDLITIIQNIKAAGALNAQLELI